MIRNNGYLDLNNYYNEVAGTCEAETLSKEYYITPSSYNKDHYYMDIEGEIFYFKDSNFGYRECMAHYIAEDMGLNSVFYDLAEFGVYRGVISSCFHKEGKEYYTGAEILDYYTENDFKSIHDYTGRHYIKAPCAELNSLDIIWQALEFMFPECKSDIPKVMNDIVDMYMFKFLIGNSDALAYNFEIEKDENHLKFCPIFDNEYSFWPENGEFAMTAEYGRPKYFMQNIRDFLSISSEEYVNRFLDFHSRFNEDYFYDIMNKVEVNHGYTFKEEEKKRIIDFCHLMQIIIDNVLKDLNIDTTRRNNG